MDPVSRLLLDRESRLPRLAPWIVVAILGHGVCVAAAIWLGKEASARPAQLPAVSVRLVQAALPAASAPPSSQRPAARPASTRPQVPPPTQPEPEPIVPEIEASDDAMAELDSEPEQIPTPRRPEPAETIPAATPAPEEAAATSSGPTSDEPAQEAPGTEAGQVGTGRRRGLSLSEDGGGSPPGIPSDFQFTYYVDRMLSLIESKWYRPPVPPETRAQVRFVITKDGRLEGIQLEISSGVSSFDRAVLRALYAANPLPPLPPAYRKPSLTVHLTFSQ